MKGLGLWHSTDMRDGAHTMRPHLASVVVQPQYKLWEHGQILDQGEEGSCVGHGWTAWNNSRPVGFTHQQDHEYALGWYERAQKIDEWPGTDYEGTSVRAGAQVARERGLIKEFVWATSRSEMDAWLTTKGPIVIGADWYHSMDQLDADAFTNVVPSSGIRGGHCVLLYGIGRGGNYNFQNSWGEEYGRSGTFRLTPENMERWIASGNFVACAGLQTGLVK